MKLLGISAKRKIQYSLYFPKSASPTSFSNNINRTSKTANIDCGKDNVGINLFLGDKYVTKFQEILEKNKNDIDNLSIELNFMVDKKND